MSHDELKRRQCFRRADFFHPICFLACVPERFLGISLKGQCKIFSGLLAKYEFFSLHFSLHSPPPISFLMVRPLH